MSPKKTETVHRRDQRVTAKRTVKGVKKVAKQVAPPPKPKKAAPVKKAAKAAATKQQTRQDTDAVRTHYVSRLPHPREWHVGSRIHSLAADKTPVRLVDIFSDKKVPLTCSHCKQHMKASELVMLPNIELRCEDEAACKKRVKGGTVKRSSSTDDEATQASESTPKRSRPSAAKKARAKKARVKSKRT